MEDILLNQLAEIARPFNKIGIKPVICGGLGVYLCFRDSSGAARGIIRATNDIDFMITKEMVLEESRRNAFDEIITGELEYVVSENDRHFRFIKTPDRHLDFLAPPIGNFEIKEHRVKLVKSKLHGRLTNEALYIDEDLRTIELTDKIEVQVPSPTNLLILKLCAFDDRDRDKEAERAQAHAFDTYIIVTLAGLKDYQEGQRFLARHGDWEVIQRVESIVRDKFSSIEQTGWQRVLEASNFFPDKNINEKRAELEKAKNRLVRWFTTP
ncbi:MAG: nucleotidyl transferase AbiEii/AbiGii toxin family protein [Sedimentisphaerales bacterium]|nr:nucleotidyl transferase AbiEii/AbiGii toxin family protein [Sedimentisphaerales bacterium]